MPPTEDFSVLLSVFAAAPGLGISLMAPDGKILYVNETAVQMYGGGTVEEHIGYNLAEVYSPEWAAEKIALLRRVADTDDRLLIRYIWEGKRIEAQYQRIPAEASEEPRIMVTMREGATEDSLIPDGFEIVKIDTANFGPLAVLTPRELEVLSLIGQGKSAKEIGQVLSCSPRTVERHRDSMGKKLDKHDRVSLALIAQAAGLELRDAHVKHVEHVRRASSAEPDHAAKPPSETEAKPGPIGALPPD
jgi:DNA-binding CsgD family transcriptional regulator